MKKIQLEFIAFIDVLRRTLFPLFKFLLPTDFIMTPYDSHVSARGQLELWASEHFAIWMLFLKKTTVQLFSSGSRDVLCFESEQRSYLKIMIIICFLVPKAQEQIVALRTEKNDR